MLQSGIPGTFECGAGLFQGGGVFFDLSLGVGQAGREGDLALLKLLFPVQDLVEPGRQLRLPGFGLGDPRVGFFNGAVQLGKQLFHRSADVPGSAVQPRQDGVGLLGRKDTERLRFLEQFAQRPQQLCPALGEISHQVRGRLPQGGKLGLGALGGEQAGGDGGKSLLELIFALFQFEAGFGQLLGFGGALFLKSGPCLFQGGFSLPELLLGLGELLVHRFQNTVVEGVDFLLAEGHLELPLDQPHSLHRRHAVQALEGGDHRLGNQGGDILGGFAFHIHAGDHHRQHVGIDLHEDRGPYRIVHGGGGGTHLVIHIDNGPIHVGAVFELEDHHAGVLL